jgi:glycerol-3-phosphate dehydrogenase
MERDADVDLLIIGGGINGAGIARDAAGRGLKVMLCEADDLGGATSSASSKLIHGGLRYLEYYKFGFVREALAEREVLLGIAPHAVWPARFVLPLGKGSRPAFLIAAGLFLYDWLAPRKHLPRSERLDLRTAPEGAPLKECFKRGFAYADCRTDDSRLAVLNATDARERGAIILPRTRCVSARREQRVWQATLASARDGSPRKVAARAIVNAAGPWAGEVLHKALGLRGSEKLRLVKGSHIVVKRLYEGGQCYVLQNEDGRIVFVMPYEGDYTLIGTTECPFAGDPAAVKISAGEILYLTGAVSRYFRTPLSPQDTVGSYAGVRPLYGGAAEKAGAITREYVLSLDAPQGSAPALSVFGGKITTYRRLAEDALEKLAPFLNPPRPARWTASAPLPGGGMKGQDFGLFLQELGAKYPWLDRAMLYRLARAYGTRAERILGSAREAAELGTDFGAGLSEAEINYLMDEEFAATAEDILWRRTKLHLRLSQDQTTRIGAYVDARAQSR